MAEGSPLVVWYWSEHGRCFLFSSPEAVSSTQSPSHDSHGNHREFLGAPVYLWPHASGSPGRAVSASPPPCLA